MVRKTPIKDAVNVFTDGSKTGCGVYMVEGRDPAVRKDCDFPFNLISDSQYVVNLVLSLEVAGQIKAVVPSKPWPYNYRSCCGKDPNHYILDMSVPIVGFQDP